MDALTAAWRIAAEPRDLVASADQIVLRSGHDAIALDAAGHERWRRTFERIPRSLHACGDAIVLHCADRRAPAELIALAADGRERWRYARRWGLGVGSIHGDDRALVVNGVDDGATRGRWVGLDPSGAVAFDVAEPGTAPLLAGAWIVGVVDGGLNGVVRTARDGTGATVISSAGASTLAASEQLLIFNTLDEPSEMIAIDLSTGRERWRARGGINVEIAIAGEHVAWVTGERRAVVHELATGARRWTSEPLPDVDDSGGYTCKLGTRALVCHAAEHVAYFSLAASAPIATRAWVGGDAPSASQFWQGRFLEARADELICWELG